MPLAECPKCRNPIPDRAAECTYCGSPRSTVSHLRCRVAPHPESVRAQVVAPASLTAKVMWIYLACLAAAVLLSLLQGSAFRFGAGGILGIFGLSATNFAVAVWFTLIPRRAGLLLAVAVVAMRTYLQWTGHASSSLF